MATLDLSSISFRHEQGESISSIAKSLGLGGNRLSKLMKEEGYKVYSNHSLRKGVLNQAKSLLEEGSTLTQTASILGVSLEAISRHLRKEGSWKGQNVPSKEDIEKASYLKGIGWSIEKIAAHLNVNRKTLSRHMKKAGYTIERGMGSSNFWKLDNFDASNYKNIYLGHPLCDLSNKETHYWLGLLASDGVVS